MPEKTVTKILSNIKSAMQHAEEWEKRKTEIEGVYLVRTPDSDLRVLLMFNPPDEFGNPKKHKGWYFTDVDTILAAKKAFNDKRLIKLATAVEKLNAVKKKKERTSEEVFKV